MSIHVNGGETPLLPDFFMPTPETAVPMAGEPPVEAYEALRGLTHVLGLKPGEQIARCYVANRPYPAWGQPGPEGGLVIASVIVEPDGFMKDREIVVNHDNRQEPLGERAITWFGAVAGDYDKDMRVGFMRGDIQPGSLDSSLVA